MNACLDRSPDVNHQVFPRGKGKRSESTEYNDSSKHDGIAVTLKVIATELTPLHKTLSN